MKQDLGHRFRRDATIAHASNQRMRTSIKRLANANSMSEQKSQVDATSSREEGVGVQQARKRGSCSAAVLQRVKQSSKPTQLKVAGPEWRLLLSSNQRPFGNLN